MTLEDECDDLLHQAYHARCEYDLAEPGSEVWMDAYKRYETLYTSLQLKQIQTGETRWTDTMEQMLAERLRLQNPISLND